MYLTVTEAAKRLGVSANTLRNWDVSGKFRPHHISNGGKRFYTEEQISDYMGIPNDVDILRKEDFLSLPREQMKILIDNYESMLTTLKSIYYRKD